MIYGGLQSKILTLCKILLSVGLILTLRCIFTHLRGWGQLSREGGCLYSHVQQVLFCWLNEQVRVAQWVKALSSNINYGNFLVFIRVIRSSVADGDESGSACGYQVRCPAANPCDGVLCCADSFYSAGHGGAFCFSPCYTTSLVRSLFLYTI